MWPVEPLARFRRRLPLPVFVMLVVLALLLLGFACACITDHPTVAIDRALTAAATLPPLIEIWSLLVLALTSMTLVVVRDRATLVRGSPAELQRFLNQRFRVDIAPGALEQVLVRYRQEHERLLRFIHEHDLFPVPADQSLQILATPGFMRPSIVGPRPPVQWFCWFGACAVAPTARQFFAFSGVLRVERFVTANRTRSSS